MGWQDDPVVSDGWQSDPVADAPKQEKQKGYIEDTYDTAREGFRVGGLPGMMGSLAWKGLSKDLPAVGAWLGDKAIDLTEGSGLSPNVRAGIATAADLGTQYAATSGPVMKAIGSVPGVVQGTARQLMTSALKPTVAMHQSGDAAKAVDTLLKYGVNVTPGGVDKMEKMLMATNEKIGKAIGDSSATVSKLSVAQRLKDLVPRLQRQVAPQSDIAAVEQVGSQFLEHPLLSQADEIPVALAQDMKTGTYRQLAKKYGQIGSADIEAQKTLARGLKEEIASAIPEIADLNKIDSELYNALTVTERRVLMDANKNPLGLAPLAVNPKAAAAFLADRSPAFKSIVARMLNTVSKPIFQKETKQAVTQAPLIQRAISPQVLPEGFPQLNDAPLLTPGSWKAPLQPREVSRPLPVIPDELLPLADKYAGTNMPIGLLEGGQFSTKSPLPKLPPQGNDLMQLMEYGKSNPSSFVETGLDFPLRQEVLQNPQIIKATDDFRQEAQRLQSILDNKHIIDQRVKAKAAKEMEQLKNEFAAGMKQLGIENDGDANGLRRMLYESGRNQLPIERTFYK